MERRISSYTGCLLGLAAGDGLGHGPERLIQHAVLPCRHSCCRAHSHRASAT